MIMRKAEILMIVLILMSFIIGASLYSRMPEKMASHWNIEGKVNGYMPKFWGLFLMPIISFGMFILFIIIPKIDPLKVNIRKFRNYYNRFIVLVILFMFYIYVLTIAWNLGWTFVLIQFLSPAFAILFFYAGILIEKAKRNFSIGIRTPWTLSSDYVWEKTHKLGSKLFKICGILCLFGFFFPDYAIFFILIPVILVTIYTFVYSYIEYQKYSKKTRRKK